MPIWQRPRRRRASARACAASARRRARQRPLSGSTRSRRRNTPCPQARDWNRHTKEGGQPPTPHARVGGRPPTPHARVGGPAPHTPRENLDQEEGMDVHSPWIAALAALFLWWFATGAILLVVRLCERRGPGTGRRATVLALPVLAVGIWGYEASLGATGPGAAHAA